MSETASEQVDRLAQTIMEICPDEIGVGDPDHGEGAVDVAIRLIQRTHVQDQMRASAAEIVPCISRADGERQGHILDWRADMEQLGEYRRSGGTFGVCTRCAETAMQPVWLAYFASARP